jgi:hypothetical protein
VSWSRPGWELRNQGRWFEESSDQSRLASGAMAGPAEDSESEFSQNEFGAFGSDFGREVQVRFSLRCYEGVRQVSLKTTRRPTFLLVLDIGLAC